MSTYLTRVVEPVFANSWNGAWKGGSQLSSVINLPILLLNCLFLFFCHFQLGLLAQILGSDDKKLVYLWIDVIRKNIIIWITADLSQAIIWISVTFHLVWILIETEYIRFQQHKGYNWVIFFLSQFTSWPSTPKTLKYVCINHGDKRFFSIWNHHKCLSFVFPLHFNTYVMCLRPL